MTAEPVRHQRSEGSIHLSMGPRGIVRLREAHAAKVRIPFGVPEAILINTGGGLAGGDHFSFDITAEENTTLTVTSQTAERVYRSLGPAAQVDVTLTARDGARLMWLPQETILFDGAALSRTITADLAVSARFLAVESVILGREAMGEHVQEARLTDRWRIHHHNGMRQMRVFGRQHQTEHAPQRVTHQNHGACVRGHQRLGKGFDLFHQMRPVAGHRVGGVVTDFFQGVYLQTTAAQFVQHDVVGAGRKTVAVEKKYQWSSCWNGLEYGSCHVSFFKA